MRRARPRYAKAALEDDLGLPLVKYVLDRRWYDLVPEWVWCRGRRGGRGTDVTSQWAKVYHDLFAHSSADAGRVKRRVDYFSRYVRDDLTGATQRGVDLVGECESTEHDGDKAYYAGLVHEVLTRRSDRGMSET